MIPTQLVSLIRLKYACTKSFSIDLKRYDGFMKMKLKWSELCPSACVEHLEPQYNHRNHIQLSRNTMNEISFKIRGCVWYDCVMVALLLFCISDVSLYYSVTFVSISCLSKKYLHDGYLQWIAGSTITAARTCTLSTFSHLQCLDVSCAMLPPLLYVFTFSFQPFNYYRWNCRT